MKNHLLLALFCVLFVLGSTREATKEEVDTFIRGKNLVSAEAKIASFQKVDDLLFISYQNGYQSQKFGLKPTEKSF